MNRMQPGRRTRGIVVTALTILTAGFLWLAWSRYMRRRLRLWLHGEQPAQFYLALDTDLLDDYSRVFGVAHNSGDSVATTRAALEHGADVIEIDVIAIRDQLFAAHRTPPRFVLPRIYRGPRLAAIWEAAVGADVIALDLKASTTRYLELVTEFLNAREDPPDRQVIVMSRDRASFDLLADRTPHAFRFLSVGAPEHLAALRGDPSLVQVIDGIAIRESLLDDATIRWLKERQLLIFAWTISDLARTNELVALGIDGITTDNLAILELLGGQERHERLLAAADQRRQRRATPTLERQRAG
jgi:glycerophosphoryl diester phosphodiesterase